MEETLRGMGRRGDIIRSMEHAVGDRLSLHHLRDFAGETAPLRLIGRVIGSGAADEAHERRFLALDGADGNQWHVAVELKPGAMPPEGAIVEVAGGAGAPRKSDLTIAAIAERNGGVYSNELHEIADPRSTSDYRVTHKRRLEALRRARVVEREADGSWRVPGNYLKRAADFERGKAVANIRVLSWMSLEELPQARSRTLLDDALERREKLDAVPAGFGGELRGTLVARRRWLIEQGLAKEEGARLVIDRKRLALMEQETVATAGARLSKLLGKAFNQPVEGERLTGIYRQSVDLPAGRFAIVERAKEFSLVPWREAIEARRGLEISGVIKREGITWEFGRTRGGPAL